MIHKAFIPKIPKVFAGLSAASTLSMTADDPALHAAVLRSRKLLNKRALTAAAASAVPIPGLDWAVDAAMLSKLIPEINKEFGLSPEQLDLLDSSKKEQVQKAASMVGSVLIGKFITRDLLMKAATKIGVRLTTKQLAKFVPFAGQIVSAAMGYAAIRYFGEEHMKDCIRVAQKAQIKVPENPVLLLGHSSHSNLSNPSIKQ